MYLLKDNQLTKLDVTEDNWRDIKAIRLIEIESTIPVNKITSDRITTISKEYTLQYELDGYIFRNERNNEQLGSYHITIGDAIHLALKMRFKVYHNDIEIILPPVNP